MSDLEFSKNRTRDASRCPCGGHNRDGKFCPFQGHIDKGHCFSCGETFFPDDTSESEKLVILKPKPDEVKTSKLPTYINGSVVIRSLNAYERNVFYNYLVRLSNTETADEVTKLYSLGTANYWYGSSVFWQIDFKGNVRGGKIMQYRMREDAISFLKKVCSRVKDNIPPVKWVHTFFKRKDEFILKQCFFGEHLLKKFPDRKVGIVESEKSALIASLYHPDIIWLASGGADGLTDEKMTILKGRDVLLFPDLGKFELWNDKAVHMRDYLGVSNVFVCDVLEKEATEEDREKGLDLGDFLIRYDWQTYLGKLDPETTET